MRRLYFEPALNINGFHAGYGGPGSKTVLPAEAGAKLDIRLVPDQDPQKVLAGLRGHLNQHGFGDGWLPQLLGEPLGRHLEVYRQVLHWFAPEKPADYAPGRFPVFIWTHGDGAGATSTASPL